MRNWLLAATAFAPLAFAAGSASAQATDTISNGVSTPIATSTAVSNGPGNVDIASGGTLTVAGTSPGVTLNSNNNVSIEGTVTASNVDNATGVLLTGGNTGSFTNTGSISITETYTATDTVNKDGVVEAPFAQGTGRYGVRLIGSAPLIGSVLLGGTGINVKGQNSYGASLEAPITGLLTVTGPVALTGDNGVALRELGGVSGPVTFSGAVSASGMASQAVVLGGDVGGSATFSSSVTSSGYSQNTRATTDPEQTNLQNTPKDVEQGGTALTVAGSVGGGLLFTGVPAGTVSGTTADVNGDGTPDGVETTSAFTSYGNAPALSIGAPTRVTTIGPFGTTGFGLVQEGTITALGVYDGVNATAVTIGGGGEVTIRGGIHNTGTITSTTYEADSTALHLLTGASLTQGSNTAAALVNDGAILSIIDHSTLVTGPNGHNSNAILIESGASLPSISNTGTISATATGENSSTYAIVDRSGTLGTITNEGVISAITTPITAGAPITGAQVAIDLSQNAGPITLVQQTNPNPNMVFGSTSGTNATTTTTVTAAVPQIIGDVRLGAALGTGVITVDLFAGGISGALALGGGPASIDVENGAIYSGAFSYQGSALALNVNNGSFFTTLPATLRLSSLNVGAAGVLGLAVDPVNNVSSSLQVSGTATITSGAKISVTLLSEAPPPTSSTAPTAQNFTLIQAAGGLNLSTGASTLLASTSYLYNATFAENAAGNALILNLQQRTAAQLGLDRSEASALPAVLVGVGANPDVERALLAPATQASFLKIYDQLLPDHGGGVFLATQAASEAIARNTTDHIDMKDPAAPQAWMKEFALGVLQDKVTGAASQVGGFGFVGGLSTSEGPLGALGVTAAFVDATSSNPDESSSTYSTFSEVDTGLYWNAESGPLRLSASGGGGYLFGVTRRQFSAPATPGNLAVTLNSKAPWEGWTARAQLFGSYQLDFGRYFVRPQAHVDYFTEHQNAYADRNGGNGFDLNVDARTGTEASGSATVVLGARFGSGALVWRPNVEVGVRDVFTGDAGQITAAFQGGGANFTLTPNPLTGVGEVARIGLKADGELFEISLDAQVENFSHYREGDAGVTIRFHF